MATISRPLPYLPEGAKLFARLRTLPWAAWLESGGAAGLGRYEILVADPHTTLVTREGSTCVQGRHGSFSTSADPLGVLGELLDAQHEDAGELPFAGGAVGYFGYELGMRLEGLPPVPAAGSLPELALGLYDWAVITDHLRGVSYWAGRIEAQDALPHVKAMLAAAEPPHKPFRAGAIVQELEPAAYRRAFDRVQGYIRAGDCYQVNLAQPFAADYSGDPWEAYQRLRAFNPAPYSAYLSLPFAQVLSASPECFLELRGGEVLTRPIKGTRPRRQDAAADRLEREALLASEKDRAENVMIVDLLRNDLGKSCVTGSVTVSELCALESFATVHHLVSSVRGALRPPLSALDLLRGCLPGGSITGAPKRRAMEIIAELEPRPREVYCGAIGYVGYDGNMATNIAIRTAVCAGGRMRFWAGGGVVADSTCEAEYQESLDKAAAFRHLLTSGPRAAG